MRRGSLLQIQLNDPDHIPLAIAKVFVDVAFQKEGRERYRFEAGETDSGGQISASYDHFEKIRRDNQSFAVMDYNTVLEDCDSVISVSVPTPAELTRRVDALRKWFPERMRALSERVKASNNYRVQVEEMRVELIDGGITRVDLHGTALRGLHIGTTDH
jgi:hypothetical protein